MRLRSLLAISSLVLCIAAGPAATAQSPFAGTWKMNPDKSQLAGDTMKFSPAQEQSIELVAGGMTYSFRTDGKTYAYPSGDVAIWRQNAPDSWTTEYRSINNKLLSTDNWMLSADGKTLTVTTNGVHANGQLYSNTAVYQRTAGTTGLLGSWKSTEVKLGSPTEMSIAVSGIERLIFKIPAIKATCEADFDGKDAVVQGPDIPTGLRLVLTRSGPYSFKLVQKINGNVVDSSVYTVSAENQAVMTQVGGAPGDPPATVVWEKQAPPLTVGVPLRP